uniref:Uncharacterized protein n=1 Tax=Cannabis sativa TaxID=3483 RepID=A0A803QBK9_CANSA
MAASANSSSFEMPSAHVVLASSEMSASLVVLVSSAMSTDIAALVVSTSSKKFTESVIFVVSASFVASVTVTPEMSKTTVSSYSSLLTNCLAIVPKTTRMTRTSDCETVQGLMVQTKEQEADVLLKRNRSLLRLLMLKTHWLKRWTRFISMHVRVRRLLTHWLS